LELEKARGPRVKVGRVGALMDFVQGYAVSEVRASGQFEEGKVAGFMNYRFEVRFVLVLVLCTEWYYVTV
jgi:hypothetical protein